MPPGYLRQQERRCWLLRRLQAADGPSYDDLVREVIAAFPERERYWTSVRAVRSVRRLAFDGFITTESDESMWLTAAGWAAASRLAPVHPPDDELAVSG